MTKDKTAITTEKLEELINEIDKIISFLEDKQNNSINLKIEKDGVRFFILIRKIMSLFCELFTTVPQFKVELSVSDQEMLEAIEKITEIINLINQISNLNKINWNVLCEIKLPSLYKDPLFSGGTKYEEIISNFWIATLFIIEKEINLIEDTEAKRRIKELLIYWRKDPD